MTLTLPTSETTASGARCERQRDQVAASAGDRRRHHDHVGPGNRLLQARGLLQAAQLCGTPDAVADRGPSRARRRPARVAARAIDVPTRPVPITRPTTQLSPRGHRAAPPRRPGRRADLGQGQLGVEVHQDPHHRWHGAGHRDLSRAHQRHRSQAHPASRFGGERRSEIVGGGEQHADEVLGLHRLRSMTAPSSRSVASKHARASPCHDDRAAGGPDPHPLRSPERLVAPGETLLVRDLARVACDLLAGQLADSRQAASRPSFTGPTRSRTSRVTGRPTASSNRRTSRLRPSAITSRTAPRPAEAATIAADFAAAGPSSSSTPGRSRASCFVGGRAVDLGEVFLLHPVARVK